jgi:UPF0755 protein
MKRFILRKIINYCLFASVALVIILLLPQHGQDELIIERNMSHANQIYALSQVTRMPYLIFVLSHTKRVRHGEYQLPQPTNGFQIMNALWKGKQKTYNFTVPEGYSAWQILKAINQETKLNGPEITQIPEGAIVATTYSYARGMSRAQFLQFMLSESRKIKDKLWAENSVWGTQNEWITFASLLEKEGLDYEDKEKISGVLMNRLKRKMRLQVDASLLYIKTDGKYDSRIKMSELVNKEFENSVEYNNKYNTYVYAGLPPGPICSAGIDALQIALKPASNKFLYYRLVRDKHVFSNTFSEHVRNGLGKRSAPIHK